MDEEPKTNWTMRVLLICVGLTLGSIVLFGLSACAPQPEGYISTTVEYEVSE